MKRISVIVISLLVVLACSVLLPLTACSPSDGQISLDNPPGKYLISYYSAQNHLDAIYCDDFILESDWAHVKGFWILTSCYDKNTYQNITCYSFQKRELWIKPVKIYNVK